jgi:hypothetical protein
MSVQSFQIIPNESLNYNVQDGGSDEASKIRILKIFITLFRNKVFDENLNFFTVNGYNVKDSNIIDLLQLTQSKQDKLIGLEEFIKQLIKCRVDLNLIVNNNIRERLRAAYEASPNDSPPDAPDETPPDDTDDTPSDAPDETPPDDPDDTPSDAPDETPPDDPDDPPTDAPDESSSDAPENLPLPESEDEMEDEQNDTEGIIDERKDYSNRKRRCIKWAEESDDDSDGPSTYKRRKVNIDLDDWSNLGND